MELASDTGKGFVVGAGKYFVNKTKQKNVKCDMGGKTNW